MDEEEIEAERSSVKVSLEPCLRPWDNTKADEPFQIPDRGMTVDGQWTDIEGNTTQFEAQSLHIHHHQPGYSASALVTMFGVGVFSGACLLALLWTHVPWG